MKQEKDINHIQEEIDSLNRQAWEIRVNDSNKAFALSKEALNLAEHINYTKGKAEGLRTLGFAYIRLSKHQEALGYINQSLQLFELLNDLRGQAEVYGYYGIIYRSWGDYDGSLKALFKSLQLSEQVNDKEGISLCYYHLGVTNKYLGNYEKALEYLLKSLSVARAIHYWVTESYALNLIGQIYFETDDYSHALSYYHQSLVLRKQGGDQWGEAGCLDNIGLIHFRLGAYNEAIRFCTDSLIISESTGDKKGQANALFHLSNIYSHQGNYNEANNCGNKSLQIRKQTGDKKGEAEILLFLAETAVNNSRESSADSFELLEKALQLGNEIKALDLLSKIHLAYYTIYKQFDYYKEALTHFETFIDIEKELHKDALNQKIQSLEATHRTEQAQKEAEIYRLRNIELANLYEESKKQKEVIEVQKRNVEDTLHHLKTTQVQLIQREKMASLGELTAGIAHEIQNPLNFVNNFSEVSIELAEEIREELNKLVTISKEKASFKKLIDDLIQNQEKINFHGKRADAIVKNMLQHSRSSSGSKEPTDINALTEEYLRLSFYGMRAKDKSFSASIQTDSDSTIEKVQVIPQDIGRVLLNLFNNAFYAVNEKKKQSPNTYEPIVQITTKTTAGKVEIYVRDNGTGMPQKVVDKVFQPFFTTKPTGEGTGLGLSLSYDIITKGHGGEIKVRTQEGSFTEFIIQLPASMEASL